MIIMASLWWLRMDSSEGKFRGILEEGARELREL